MKSGTPIGGYARTSLPTAVSNAAEVDAMFDVYGRNVPVNTTVRELVGKETTTITSSTSETTIVTAAASVFNDLTMLYIANTSATAVRVDIRDDTAGTIMFSLYIPAGDMRGFATPVPIPQTAVNKNWTAQSSASVDGLRIFAQFQKNR